MLLLHLRARVRLLVFTTHRDPCPAPWSSTGQGDLALGPIYGRSQGWVKAENHHALTFYDTSVTGAMNCPQHRAPWFLRWSFKMHMLEGSVTRDLKNPHSVPRGTITQIPLHGLIVHKPSRGWFWASENPHWYTSLKVSKWLDRN